MVEEKQRQVERTSRLSALVYRYLSFIDNFLFVAVLIPIVSWLFIAIYFQGLPIDEYKKILNRIWFFPFLIFIVVWVLEIIAIYVLKIMELPVTEINSDGTSILALTKLHEKTQMTTGFKKILIIYIIHSRFLIKLVFGWIIFGGIIKFFSLN